MFTNFPSATGQMTSDIANGNVSRVLAMRLDNIGDVVMLEPALRVLREKLPEAEITLMTSSGASEVSSLIPWVDKVFIHDALWQDISSNTPLESDLELNFIERLR